VTHCQTGEIPLHRISLETLSRFATLHDYYGKAPLILHHGRTLNGESGSNKGPSPQVDALALQSAATPPPTTPPPVPDGIHKHVVQTQMVKFIGMGAEFSLWNPTVDIDRGENQSIEQSWIVDVTRTQILESGFIVSPDEYFDTLTHVFIYSTADNYATACLDSQCEDFVQVSANFFPGDQLTPIALSTPALVNEVRLTWKLDNKNDWWFFLGTEAVGYFKKEHFKNGALPTGGTEFDVGGEVSADKQADGTIQYPEMGNGILASTADLVGGIVPASITGVFYIDLVGQEHSSNLIKRPQSNTGPCFDLLVETPDSFYFGGPGGPNC
jgi:hypothetical protein